MKRILLTGQRFGRLLVLQEIERYISRELYCIGLCRCGNVNAFTRCSSCRKCYDSEMGWGRLVMAQRELLGLTRKQLGERLGLSPKTIKKYEWTYPSKRYKKAIEKAVGQRRVG